MSVILSSLAEISDYFPKHIGTLWYLVSPKETTFEFPHEVPDYQQQIWMPFFLLLILEQLILLRKKRFRLNDQVTSLSHWMLHETIRRNVIVGFTEFFLAVPNILYTLPFMRGLAEDILYPGTRYGHGILLSLPWTFVITGLIAAIMKFTFCGPTTKCITAAKNLILR